MAPSGNRLARTYTKVTDTELDICAWPSSSYALNPALHDIRYHQGLLRHDANFAPLGQSQCMILELYREGDAAHVHQFMDDESTMKHLKDASSNTEVVYRVVYCWLEKAEEIKGTSFRHTTSLSQPVATNILKTFKVTPQFLPKMLGEPDYLAPGLFQMPDGDTFAAESQFYCQHPRWNIHNSETPVSAIMNHDPETGCTTYIVSCGSSNHSSMREQTVERLQDWWKVHACRQSKDFPSPFMLHCVISQASLNSAKQLFNELRHRLYDVLDEVDAYARSDHRERRTERAVLERATVHLHNVSQDIDSTMASLDMAMMVAENLQRAIASSKVANTKEYALCSERTAQAAAYLAASHASQKRWLLSWKSRKDIAMNLVYNLVTQQDAASSNATAQLAQADGNAMKAIAALTMIFLPATFMATFYGMASMESATWKSYWIVTVPLTVAVLCIWWLWIRWFPAGKIRLMIGPRAKRLVGATWRMARRTNAVSDVEEGRSDSIAPLSTATTLQVVATKDSAIKT